MLTLQRRRLLQAGLATAGGASTLAYSNRVRAQALQPIEIPILMSLSGFAESMGSQVAKGSDLTAEYINSQGGILGRQIKLRYFDDKGRPNDAAAAAREAISAGFTLIGGGLLTSSILAVQSILKEANAVMISPSGSGVTFTSENYSPNLFNCMENDYLRARSMAKVAAEKFPHITSWAGVFSDQSNYFQVYEIFSKFAAQDYAAKGIKVTFAPPVTGKFGNPDWRTQVTQLMNTNAEGLFHTVAGGDSLTFWQQARPMGISTRFKAVIDQSLDFVFMKSLKRNMPNNLWTLVGWYPGLYKDNKMAQGYYDLYKSRTGDAYPSQFIQYGNFAVSVIASAIEAAKGKTDTASIIAATEGLKLETIKGPARIRKEDHLWIGDINLVNYAPSDDDIGFKVVDSIKVSAEQILPPVNPGKPFTF